MSDLTDSNAEIEAMRAIAIAFEGLEEDARRRVLAWAVDRFAEAAGVPQLGSLAMTVAGSESLAEASGNLSSPADLFDAARPSTEPERVLVIAYWFQEIEGEGDIDSLRVNNELKHLGHRVSNVTRAFTQLQQQKPALVMQTKKLGSKAQSRKRYSLTEAGRRQVQEMIRRTPIE